ncbi:MAG: pyridoxamine 5'-phosphate oxidase family protein [Acidimicrobiales bacterium]
MQSNKVEGSTLTDVADLRRAYRMPAKTVLAKSVPRIDPAAAGFIALFGDHRHRRRHLHRCVAPWRHTRLRPSARHHAGRFGDLTGNNRLDSFSNLVQHPAIGMIFFVPGTEELLRINGTARLSTDPEPVSAARSTAAPNVAVEVTVQECYALRRRPAAAQSGIRPPGRPNEPDPARADPDREPRARPRAAPKIDADLQEYYRNDVWNVGGEADGQA